MLDPRIYRMSLILPAVALVVLAFSLTGQPGALRSSLPPTAFNGANVTATMNALSNPRANVVKAVRTGLSSSRDGFSVSVDHFQGRTADGERELTNVVATRPGTMSGGGSVVVVAPRGSPGLAGLSGTATLLELGGDLGGETLQRTVVLASIDGSPGGAGAARLAARLPRPVDAVVVLGDVASTHRAQPIIVPWSSGEGIAPARLRNTLSAALSGQASIHAGSPDLLNQLAHLAFPLTISAQGPFAARGLPAVELSLSGERGLSPGAQVADTAQLSARLNATGRGVLSVISALNGGAAVAAPSAYVLFDHEVVPGWAVSLFVLALIVPVLLTMVDGLARARRRRYPLGRALGAVLVAAVPFLAAALVVVLGRAVGALHPPPGAVGPGVVPVTGGAVAVMAVALLAALGCGVPVRSAMRSVRRGTDGRDGRGAIPARRRERGNRRPPAGTPAVATVSPDDGTAAAMLLVLSVSAVLVWAANPFAAALLVPALHLWLWSVDSDLALPVPARIVMLVLGAVPTAGLVLFYAHSLGFGPLQLVWEAVLLLSGHVVSWPAVVEFSLVLGCGLTAVVLVVAAARRPEPVAPPVTVRGPVTYAGPGSLGGTKSALRR